MAGHTNKRAGTILMIGVLLLAAVIILAYMTYTSSLSEHFESQDYNNFACKYMSENQEALSIDKNLYWLGGEINAKPLEAAHNITPCGLVINPVTNNTGNVTMIIEGLANAACGYGNNNTFDQFTWVRSLPVNVTDGDVGYNTLNPSGTPPGADPCYLIWRINNTYIDRQQTINTYYSQLPSAAENGYKTGTIKEGTRTTLRISYFSLPICATPPTISGGPWYLKCRTLQEPAGVVEIWGVPE